MVVKARRLPQGCWMAELVNVRRPSDRFASRCENASAGRFRQLPPTAFDTFPGEWYKTFDPTIDDGPPMRAPRHDHPT
jgi:hypothetical protein